MYYPSTPTVHTNVRSPLTLSAAILWVTRPVLMSHLRNALSDPPVISHSSVHSWSPSSSLPSVSSAFLEALGVGGVGGPHAMLNKRHLTLSNRRECDKVSCSSDKSRTDPSSQPSAREVEAGLTAKDQIAPPWELIERYRDDAKGYYNFRAGLDG
jgi:hypothetical protein